MAVPSQCVPVHCVLACAKRLRKRDDHNLVAIPGNGRSTDRHVCFICCSDGHAAGFRKALRKSQPEFFRSSGDGDTVARLGGDQVAMSRSYICVRETEKDSRRPTTYRLSGPSDFITTTPLKGPPRVSEADNDHYGNCICTTAPGLAASPFAITRKRRGVLLSPWTIWRIGPVALTIADPAGLVMNAASGSSGPSPLALLASAST